MAYPRYSLRERATNDGTGNRTYAPHGANDSKPLASLPQRYQVSDEDFSQSNEPATSDTLEGSADKKGSEPIGRRSNNGADEEEDQSHHHERFSTEDVREFGETGLKDGGAEKKRCAGPESLDCGALQGSCHDLIV